MAALENSVESSSTNVLDQDFNGLDDMQFDTTMDTINGLNNLYDALNTIDSQKSIVDSVLQKNDTLKQKESGLIIESEYRRELEDNSTKLSKYSTEILDAKKWIKKIDRYGSAEKRKMKTLNRTFQNYVSEATNIENRLNIVDEKIETLLLRQENELLRQENAGLLNDILEAKQQEVKAKEGEIQARKGENLARKGEIQANKKLIDTSILLSAGKFGTDKFLFNEGIEKTDENGKFIEFKGQKYYEYKEGFTGLGYQTGVNEYNVVYLYIGNFVNGKGQGKGVKIRSNGEKYEGDFVDGKYEGKGFMVCGHGDLERGISYDLDNGLSYEGDFVDGKYEGEGTKIWIDGGKYKGEFKDWLQDGKGIMTWANGNQYIGEYEKGKRTKGVFIVNTGKDEIRYNVDRIDGKSTIISGGDGSNNGKFVHKGEIVDELPIN